MRYYPHKQAEFILSHPHGNLSIFAGMPVTRDQIIAFIYAAMAKMNLETPTELARACHVNVSTINKFLKDEEKEGLAIKTISRIERESGLPFFQVSTTVQKNGAKMSPPRGSVDLEKTIPTQGGSARDLPIYGEDKLNQMAYAFDDPTPLGYVDRPIDLASEKAYGLRIKDNVMAPRLVAGDTAYVDPTRPAVAGDTLVVRLKDKTGWVRRLLARELERIRVDTYELGSEETFANEDIEGLHVIVGADFAR